MAFRDLFFFDKMIAPVLIRILFWLGLAGIVIVGLTIIFSGGHMMGSPGFQRTSGFTIGSLLFGLFYIVMTGIFWRVFCEFVIVLFSIHDRLGEIRDSK